MLLDGPLGLGITVFFVSLAGGRYCHHPAGPLDVDQSLSTWL
jgi:hypothetical protein